MPRSSVSGYLSVELTAKRLSILMRQASPPVDQVQASAFARTEEQSRAADVERPLDDFVGQQKALAANDAGDHDDFAADRSDQDTGTERYPAC